MTTLYTTTDAAQRLGCSRRTIQRHCERERIGTRLGRDVMLSPSDLARLRKSLAEARENKGGRPRKSAPTA